jgi:hypothetical protein
MLCIFKGTNREARNCREIDLAFSHSLDPLRTTDLSDRTSPALVNWGCITTGQLNGQSPTRRGFSFAIPRFQQPSARPASSAPAIRALTVVVPTATLRLHSSGSGTNCPCHEQAICSGGFRASGPCPWPIACACCLPRFRWPSHSRRSCTYPTATRPRGPVRPSSANSARHSIAAPRHLPQHTHL